MELIGNINTTESPITIATPALLNAGGSPSIAQGVVASRPAAGSVGRLFLATDQGLWYRDTGSSWVVVTGAGSGTVSSVAATGSAGLVIGGSPITGTGTLTFTLDAELQGLAALTTTGLVQRTGAGTYTTTSATTPPAGASTQVQFNNAGAFGASTAFTFSGGVNPSVNILGTPATTQLTVGGNNLTNNATAYIEVNTDTAAEGLRCYFRRTAPGSSAWITYDYDGTAPNLRLTDEDDDPSYIQFNTIGAGTFATPALSSVMAVRGGIAAATTGFSWYTGTNTNGATLISGNAPIMELDTQWLRLPTGTSAQRPTPVAGQIRYNTTNSLPEIATNPYGVLPGFNGIARTVIDEVRGKWKDDFLTGSTSATGTATFGELGWSVTSGGGTNALSTPAADLGHPGILRLGTGGANNNRVQLHIGIAASTARLAASQPEYMAWVVRIPTITTVQVRAGIGTDIAQAIFTAAGAGAAAAFFQFDPAVSASWQFISRAGTTIGTVSTGPAVVANTWYLIELFNTGTVLTPVINGVTYAPVTLTLPATGVAAGIICQTATGASRTVDVDYFSMLTRELARF